MYLALVATLPALLAVLIWGIATPSVENGIVESRFATEMSQLQGPQVQAFIRDARAIAFGGVVGFADASKEAAATLYRSLHATSSWVIVLIVAALVATGVAAGYRRIAAPFRARHVVERILMVFLIACSAVAILTTAGIVLSLIFESLRFFSQVPIYKFLFGLHWSPQSAFTGAGAAPGEVNPDIFGAVPLFAGTLLITLIAMLVAAPLGLLSAIYLSDYASPRVRAVAKPVLEILAGIPTVVYGFFAALTVAPFFRGIGESLGLGVASELALAAGIVMGIMIIPFVSSLSDDVINAVPQVAARRLGRARRHQVGDHPQGGAAGGPAGHRLGAAPGGQPGDRRDDDRRHGGRPGGQPHHQPAGGGHHRHRADRDPAGRRPGIRQRQDAGGLRARPRALRHHPDAQHHRAARREEVPGTV